MESIWKRIQAQAEEYRKAGTPLFESKRRAMPPMTKSEAIEALGEAIEAIKGFSADIRAILGSHRDPECMAQIALNNKYVMKYQKEIDLYKRMTDEQFKTGFPTLVLRDVASSLASMELARDTFVWRGPRYNPPR